MLKKLAHFVLFGNYYLALCIIALSAETAVKNSFVITDVSYYLFVFFSVVVYYTHAYIGANNKEESFNLRTAWYYRNRIFIRVTQIIFTVVIAFLGIHLFVRYHFLFRIFNTTEWLLLLLFPLIALLYYGAIFPAKFHIQLRNIAWLKPFIIGFVCSGIIVIYPMLFGALQEAKNFHLSASNLLYFFTNWLYTTAIAIMFDIKDFAADHNYQLKTFVVAKGLRYTLFFILLPLASASLVSFLFFASIKHFSAVQIIINIIPFFLLLLAATSLRRRKGILYYLVVIDGLLLVKAAFGITAMMLGK